MRRRKKHEVENGRRNGFYLAQHKSVTRLKAWYVYFTVVRIFLYIFLFIFEYAFYIYGMHILLSKT